LADDRLAGAHETDQDDGEGRHGSGIGC
jgi:hypothetical protein